MNTFILASASPRRTELLKQAGITHLVFPSACEEHTDETVPSKVVEDLSAQKAAYVYEKYLAGHAAEDFIVLGSDTVVSCNDQILGKPAGADDAKRMITLLQNNTHQVYTGVTLIQYQAGRKTVLSFHECSDVSIFPMTAKEIASYVQTNEPLDKAGAYGIQGRFAIYVKRICGDYNNIVGLPIARIYQELKKL